jgi:hypothetical protein
MDDDFHLQLLKLEIECLSYHFHAFKTPMVQYL